MATLQEVRRDWSAVFKGYAGAAVPKLQHPMAEAARTTTQIANATILDDDDRAAAAQLYWMLLKFCSGAAWNMVLDSEGLEAWRQLTDKCEPKMMTRFGGQLMTLLPSVQGDTSERLTTWEREIATYERDSCKVLDDEIKIGTFLIKLPETPLKTHLLMRVDALMKWTDSSGEVVAISRAIAAAQAQPTPMDVGATSKRAPDKGGQGSEGTRSGKSAQSTRERTALTLIRRAASAVRSVTLRPRVVPLGRHSHPRRKGAAGTAKAAKVQQNVLDLW